MKNNRKLNYPVRLISHGLRLPTYVRFFEDKATQHDALIQQLTQQVANLSEQLSAITESLKSYSKLDDRLADLQHQLANINTEYVASDNTQKTIVNSTVSDNHRYDQFYKAFEDRFRGPEDVIEARLREHLPLFQSLPLKLRKKPIVDIGCGRGELLAILKGAGLRGVGIDMNGAMVQRAIDNGFEAHAMDAKSYLAALKPGSLAAVTGFHIVEHIPFEALMDIFNECYRAVSHKGFVLFETPNPETLSVGAHTFYLDPSHQRPVPPQLLAFMLEYVGFNTEILRLHEIEKTPDSIKSEVIKKLHKSTFGPADYAVVGRKA